MAARSGLAAASVPDRHKEPVWTKSWDIGPLSAAMAVVPVHAKDELARAHQQRAGSPRAVAVSGGLDALGLARHLWVIGRIGHVAVALGLVALVHVKERL